MAGQSKWANIKHRKGAQDKKRAKLFSRILREISVAVGEGGEDPDSNSTLRLAIQNAKGANIPKDTVERAISKAGSDDKTQFQNPIYEGYGPGGVAVLLVCATDNINRTVANIRGYFNKLGGSLSTSGSVAYLFERKGVFTISSGFAESKKAEGFELALIDAGAEDIEKREEDWVVFTSFENFGPFQLRAEELNWEINNAEIVYLPNLTKILDPKEGIKFLDWIEKLEDDDDIDSVFHDLELTDELNETINKAIDNG